MADKTGIEWTDATWNPIVGCAVVSPGCTNCYAMKQAARIERMAEGAGRTSHYAGTTEQSKAGAVWTGRVAMAPDRILTQPMRWTKPRVVFVNSMGDLFHEDVPDAWIDKVFAVMALCPQHTFQCLTKRSGRMREYILSDRCDLINDEAAQFSHWDAMPQLDAGPLRNVWLGVSAEDQRRANERIPDLLSTPAAVRFVSAEPLLGPIDFDLAGIDWVIVGGESGPGARPMHPDWARLIRDQCAAAGTAFFMKQMSKKGPIPADLFVRETPNVDT